MGVFALKFKFNPVFMVTSLAIHALMFLSPLVQLRAGGQGEPGLIVFEYRSKPKPKTNESVKPSAQGQQKGGPVSASETEGGQASQSEFEPGTEGHPFFRQAWQKLNRVHRISTKDVDQGIEYLVRLVVEKNGQIRDVIVTPNNPDDLDKALTLRIKRELLTFGTLGKVPDEIGKSEIHLVYRLRI